MVVWRSFDHVVRIEVLERFEIVERSARASRPAHVHVDDRETHEIRELGQAAFRTRRVRVAVARVFDQRRVGTRACRRRKVDVDRQLGAVARGQVRVAAVGDPLVEDAGIPGFGGLRVDGDRAGFFAVGCEPDPVARFWRDGPEQQPAGRVRGLRGDRFAVRAQQRHLGIRRQARYVELFHAPVRAERGRARRCHEAESAGHEHHDDAGARTTPKRLARPARTWDGRRRPARQAAAPSRPVHPQCTSP